MRWPRGAGCLRRCDSHQGKSVFDIRGTVCNLPFRVVVRSSTMGVVGAVSAIVGLVVAVTNLIDSFRTPKAYIDNIIDAPTLVEDLVFDVDHITYRLQNLQGHLQDRRIAQTIAQANSQRLIKEITKTSEELRATVQKVLATDAAEVPAEQNEVDGTRIRVRRMKWLQVEPECRRLSKTWQGHSVKLDGVMLAICA